MMNTRYKSWSVFALMLFLAAGAHAQPEVDIDRDKLAQTTFKFLGVSPDARAAALGDAMTAVETRSSVAMFYNPAGMARMDGFASANAGYAEWFAGIVYNSASFALRPANGRYGVFGVSLMYADYGDDFIGTVQGGDNGYTTYEEMGLANPTPTSLSAGVGYAMAVTDRFSVGANAKYVTQDLGVAATEWDASSGGSESVDNEESTMAFDFGVLYKTGFRSLNFAMSVRNFAQEVTYVSESAELPLTFNVGMAMDMMDFTSMNPNLHSFQLAVEAQRPRDYNEQLKLGGEYTFMNLLSVRAGYSYPTDVAGVNLGAGLNYEISGLGFGVDYAFTQYETLSNVQRFSVNLSF